jgi:N-acetylmuramoyl-L-alanine amidase
MADIRTEKKRKGIPASSIFILFVFALLAASVLMIELVSPLKTLTNTVVKPDAPVSLPYTIVIDAGHGGMDAGASGASGVREDVLNLDVSKKLQSLLAASGATVIMTRETDEAVAGTKDADMKKRREVIENSGAAIVVSIHMNFFSDRSSCGPQVFFYEGSESGRALAKEIQSSMNEMLSPEKPRVNMKGNYFILRSGSAPGVIVECGFLSNTKEEALLKDESYRGKCAEAIFAGIKNFFARKDSGETISQ